MHINCRRNLIDLSKPKVMGILNVTPDSFYDGGRFNSEKQFLTQVEKMLTDETDFIDVGAYSSKPNAENISEKVEIKRLENVLKSVVKSFPEAIISVDTFRSEMAKMAVDNGVSMINDISAGNLDEKMMETVAKLHVPYIMMHMRGTPKTMTALTNYDDVCKEMLVYFSEKINLARQLGIYDLLIDPGFGFAKTIEQNYEILQNLHLFQLLEIPMLVGISRKSMVYKPLGSSPAEALNGTTALHMLALQNGAKILRVHDVKEAVECVKLFNLMTI